MLNSPDVFRVDSAKRRTFPGIKETNLLSLMEWLFEQSGTSGAFARVCLEMFIETGKVIKGKRIRRIKNIICIRSWYLSN